MTGYKSKKEAALDEDGMYLVHHTKARLFDKLGNKVPDEDDDIQVYQRTWVALTENEIEAIEELALTKAWAIRMAMAHLKEKNT